MLEGDVWKQQIESYQAAEHYFLIWVDIEGFHFFKSLSYMFKIHILFFNYLVC